MIIYDRYRKLNLDTALPGLEYNESKDKYFCTPKGAEIIGWAGVDSIHYCFVEGFSEMVFAVNPMSTPGNYVHPVARDFADFLRLLLTCGDAGALEQVYRWDKSQFDAFLQDNPLTTGQQAVIDIIREKLLLGPMEQPFAYIKELQAEFDYSLIKYTEEYYEWIPVEPKIPEWKVYFDGNFWGYHGSDRAGKEISLNKQFVWNNEAWNIPSVYICSKGLVMDFCLQVPAECIRSFVDKWNLSIKNDGTDFTNEQQMQMDAENPLVININPEVMLNGTVLSCSHGCGISWNPCFSEDNSLEAKSVTLHYGLDPAYGWAVWRAAFPWPTKHKPQITTLGITLIQKPIAMTGPHFHVSAPGERITFIHPATGAHHTLIMLEYDQLEMSRKHFGSRNQEFPTHYTIMSYTLSPDLPDGTFTVTDCVHSDPPRQKITNPNGPQAFCNSCAGIIGGASNMSAIILGGSGHNKLHAACSALHFEPVEDVEWRMVFHVKTRKDITVSLM